MDNSKDEAKFRQDLLNIAKTTLRWGTMVLGCCGHTELLEPYPNAVASEFSTALWQAAGVGPSALKPHRLHMGTCMHPFLLQTPVLPDVLWKDAHCRFCLSFE